mmetsp:Transcript_59841/g.133350  ORF Transcript_59841/g.133350 Transcript_59841/m.133350 type:complete len:115 (+) Transcript_59841:1350-1694(+)
MPRVDMSWSNANRMDGASLERRRTEARYGQQWCGLPWARWNKGNGMTCNEWESSPPLLQMGAMSLAVILHGTHIAILNTKGIKIGHDFPFEENLEAELYQQNAGSAGNSSHVGW